MILSSDREILSTQRLTMAGTTCCAMSLQFVTGSPALANLWGKPDAKLATTMNQMTTLRMPRSLGGRATATRWMYRSAVWRSVSHTAWDRQQSRRLIRNAGHVSQSLGFAGLVAGRSDPATLCFGLAGLNAG